MLVGFRLKPNELCIASAARWFCDAAEIKCQEMTDDLWSRNWEMVGTKTNIHFIQVSREGA